MVTYETEADGRRLARARRPDSPAHSRSAPRGPVDDRRPVPALQAVAIRDHEAPGHSRAGGARHRAAAGARALEPPQRRPAPGDLRTLGAAVRGSVGRKAVEPA